jgi:hypothetical protein
MWMFDAEAGGMPSLQSRRRVRGAVLQLARHSGVNPDGLYLPSDFGTDMRQSHVSAQGRQIRREWFRLYVAVDHVISSQLITMTELREAKPGDKLYVWCGPYDRGRIEEVERTTPSGRLITRSGAFDPDGYLRGEKGRWHRTRARPATADDVAGINRFHLVSKIASFNKWEKLTPDELKAVAEIVKRHTLND